jgi:hypothetical protein
MQLTIALEERDTVTVDGPLYARDSEDNTACSGDLTVVSYVAVNNLRKLAGGPYDRPED